MISSQPCLSTVAPREWQCHHILLFTSGLTATSWFVCKASAVRVLLCTSEAKILGMGGTVAALFAGDLSNGSTGTWKVHPRSDRSIKMWPVRDFEKTGKLAIQPQKNQQFAPASLPFTHKSLSHFYPTVSVSSQHACHRKLFANCNLRNRQLLRNRKCFVYDEKTSYARMMPQAPAA